MANLVIGLGGFGKILRKNSHSGFVHANGFWLETFHMMFLPLMSWIPKFGELLSLNRAYLSIRRQAKYSSILMIHQIVCFSTIFPVDP